MNDLTVGNILTPRGSDSVPSDVSSTPIDSIMAAEIEDDILEMNESFDLDEFQVVRREFFAHLHEPSICFNNRKFYVNSACLQRHRMAGTQKRERRRCPTSATGLMKAISTNTEPAIWTCSPQR